MTPVLFRTVMRWFHIVVALFMGSYFYSPLGTFGWSMPLIKFVLIPLLILSGLAMWKQAKVMKWLKPR